MACCRGCCILVVALAVLAAAMAWCGRWCLVVVALTVLAAAYLLNSPIPEGFSQPWKLRMLVAPIKILKIVGRLVDFIYGEPMVLTRKLQAYGKPEFGTNTGDRMFDGVPVRLFVPDGGSSVKAGIIFIHGGGFVMGSVEGYSEVCRNLSSSTGMSVVSIEYRLAPEHRYPAAFQDCLAATQHFLKHAAEFGVDPEKIAIAGDSAGGALSAAVALYLRDHKVKPALKAQVLIYTALQAIDFNLPSHAHDSTVLTTEAMTKIWLCYSLGDAEFNPILRQNKHTPPEIKEKYAKYLNVDDLPRDLVIGYTKPSTVGYEATVWEKLRSTFLDPYFSPGIADDLANLPKTFIMTAGLDPLRDAAILFALRMKSAGTDVTHNHYKSAFHGIYNYPKFNETKQIRDDVRNFIIQNM